MLALPFFNRLETLLWHLTSRQDLVVAPLLVGGLFLAARIQARRAETPSRLSLSAIVLGGCVLLLLAGWSGHYLVFGGYDISRDEQMANFDASIFRNGRLFLPITSEWRPFADALNLRFIMPIGARQAWISGYLPVNAAFRAAISLFADPALASPLMAALGLLCLWRISARLWPQSSSTQFACILLYIGSSQIVIMAMTAFAMSMHLALNLLWLWLFLIDKPRTHALAMLVGFAATGIHQPLFHPMFVFPFFGLLALDRRWQLLSAYLLAYAAIESFWLLWPIWVSSQALGVVYAGPSETPPAFTDRLSVLLSHNDLPRQWCFAIPNLLRMICWQHPYLLPLALLGLWTSWRTDRLAGALAISFLLPILVVGILTPLQGHGWGYRYMHPVLGNGVLLAGYGVRELERRGLAKPPALLATSAAALLVLLPAHAWMARNVAMPFVEVHRSMMSSGADIVLVDTKAVDYSEDVIFNDPTLSSRPTLLIAQYVDTRNLSQLCNMGSLAFMPGPRLAPIARLWGQENPAATPEFLRLQSAAAHIPCRIKQL